MIICLDEDLAWTLAEQLQEAHGSNLLSPLEAVTQALRLLCCFFSVSALFACFVGCMLIKLC